MFLDRSGIEALVTEEVIRETAGRVKDVLSTLVSRQRAATLASINESTLRAAAAAGKTDVLDILVDLEPDITSEKALQELHHITEFRAAVESNNIQRANKLLQSGVSPDLKDMDGATPLQFAVQEKYEEMVAILVKQSGVDVNSQDNYESCPLLKAVVEDGSVRVVSSLVEAGADLQPVVRFTKTDRGDWLLYDRDEFPVLIRELFELKGAPLVP